MKKIIITKNGQIGLLEGKNLNGISVSVFGAKEDPQVEEIVVSGMKPEVWEKWKNKPDLKEMRKFKTKKIG